VEVRHCRQCDEWSDHDVRLEGNVATGEEFSLRFCTRCGLVDEKTRVQRRAAIISVHA